MHTNKDDQKKYHHGADLDDSRETGSCPDHDEKDLHQGEAEWLNTTDVADLTATQCRGQNRKRGNP